MGRHRDTLLGATCKEDAARLFADWWNDQDNSSLSFAAYGAGADFHEFCKAAPGFKDALKAMLDESGAIGCATMSSLPSLGLDCVVVCSSMHQESMRARLRRSGFDGEIVLPYRQEPGIGTLGIFAWCPENDWPQPKKNSSLPTPKASKKIKSILLFQPPFAKANWRHKKTIPLGLLHLASAVRRAFPEVRLKLYDAHIRRDSWEDAKSLIDSLDFDLLACSYWSAQAEPAFLMSDYVMKTKDAVVVHGGVHPSLAPHEASMHCHKAIQGEGELAFVELIRHLNEGRTLESFTFEEPLIEHLDDIAPPAWDILETPEAYDHPMHVVGGRRLPVMGSRGCPFSCSFCSSPLIWKRRVRWHSPSRTADEMDEIHSRFGVDRFHFWDDNFLLDRRHARALCEELLGRGRKYLWCGLSRGSDILNSREILPLLKRAGCVGIEIGVESFSDQVSKATGKGEFAAETAAAAKALADSGIAPLYTHMLFVPGETISSYPMKEAFLSGLSAGMPSQYKSDGSLGQLATPHIGTGFAKEAESLGMILWGSSCDSFHHRVNFIPDSLLDDVPVRVSSSMPGPLPWLSKIVQSAYDWTSDDMRSFVSMSGRLWDAIDGERTLRGLSQNAGKEMDIRKSAMFCALLIVGWARCGAVGSAKGDASK